MAVAASEGLITIKFPDGSYGNAWQITAHGVKVLNMFEAKKENKR